jgi:hypothetical protein
LKATVALIGPQIDLASRFAVQHSSSWNGQVDLRQQLGFEGVMNALHKKDRMPGKLAKNAGALCCRERNLQGVSLWRMGAASQ